MKFKKCEDCNGTGKELCNNPDHGGIDGPSDRFGCPCCGSDELHRTKHNCDKCKGRGHISIITHILNKLS